VKCIVSGATGFIGRRVVALLQSHRHSVAIWTRNPFGRTLKNVEQFAWDPLSGEPSAESLAGVDAVIHLAGEPVAQRWNDEVKGRIRDSRVLGTRRLVNAIARLKEKPSVLVSASAIGYYGDRGDEILTETSGPGSGFLADTCRGWESEADMATDAGLRVAKLRIGFVLGKDGGALKEMAPLFRAFMGGRLGSGKQWMPWIHADDVAALFVHAVEAPVTGVWNATAPYPVTNTEFTRELARTVHRPALFPVPHLALQVAFGELGQHMLDSARVVPDAAMRAGFEFRYPTLGLALAQALS
jgi:uncharacterized protein (TIGR01777 family)